MQPRVQFVHLRLPDRWPTSADEFWRIVDQHQMTLPLQTLYFPGTTLGTLGDERLQSAVDVFLADRNVVVQVALLSLPFFQECDAYELRDARDNPSVRIHCPQVQRLVEDLARQLLLYEDLGANPATVFLTIEQELAHCLRRLEWAQNLYLIQYDLDRLPYRPVKPADLEEGFASYSQMLQAMDREQYLQAWGYDPNAGRKRLVSSLQALFHSHITWPKNYVKYRNICVDTWVADVLQAFGIEEGPPAAIIHRFRARAAREPLRLARRLERSTRAQAKARQRQRRRAPR